MLTVREVEDKDLLPLAEFLPRGFPYTTTDHSGTLSSNCGGLPIRHVTDQFPRGWILENEASIVGFIGNIPVHFLLSRSGANRSIIEQLVCRSFSSGYIQYQAFQ